jgi:hypothetical protein
MKIRYFQAKCPPDKARAQARSQTMRNASKPALPRPVYYLILIGYLFFLLPNSAFAQQEDVSVLQAKKQLAGKNHIPETRLKLQNKANANYRFSGKRATSVKFVDDKGRIYGGTFDKDGKEVDANALAEEDLAAKYAKYGKLEPEFFDKLAKEPQDKPVKAILWLKIPPYEQLKRPDVNEKLTTTQIQDLLQKVDMYAASKTAPVIASVMDKLKKLGYKAQGNTVGVFYTEVPPKAMRAIEQWDEVQEIADGSIKEEPALAMARVTTGADIVNDRFGITGTGITIAQIESQGGRVAADNPYLPMASITQDTDFVCPDPNDHATGVAGILKSTGFTTGQYISKGFATGATLWAGGSCSGNITELHSQSTKAVNQRANILNLSWGSLTTTDTSANDSDKFYDRIVFNNWRTVVPIAGNEACNGGAGRVRHPGMAYNAITVGAFNDAETGSWNDDVMDPCSSWRNPNSLHGDVEKPDVVAPGSHIYTTTTTDPFFMFYTTGGTSFSAPMVSAESALLMQMNPTLVAWPELIKAIIIASSLHNLQGSTLPSPPRIFEDSVDGYGGIDILRARYITRNLNLGRQGGSYSGCTNSIPSVPMSLNKERGRARVALEWDVNPDYPSYSSRPNIDLDISVIDPNGRLVATSSRFDSNVEAVEFNPVVTGTYQLYISKSFCDSTFNSTNYGAAWIQDQAFLLG